MTDYVHHVPGRLRVRSKVFRCDSASRASALRKLRAADGVRTVRLNPKAGSVTVCYDTAATGPKQILDFLAAECLAAPQPSVAVTSTRERPAKPAGNLGAEIGRMALSVLVNKGVSYSLSSLLGARI